MSSFAFLQDLVASVPWPKLALFPVLLLFWRVWRFSLVPMLYLDAPRELPYWIPGHAWGFFKNSNEVLERARIYFGNTKEVYAITVAGETLCVVTAPQDVGDIYKNTTTISWHRFVKEIYTWMGISPQSITNMWETTSSKKLSTSSRAIRAPHEMIEEYHRQQLHPGDKFELLINERILPNLQRELSWDAIKTHPACIHSSDSSITFSLWDWCTDVLINGTTSAYFGKKIFEINPDLLKANLVWERTSWKYMYKLPRFLAGDMFQAKDEIVTTLRKYFETPKEERSDALYFVGAVEDELRTCNLSDDEIARISMLHHWATTGNIYKVAFWTVAYLIHNPALLANIREEIAPVLVGDTLNLKHLMEKCPRLEALFNEILRINLASALARQVVSPTVIGGKVLHGGAKIMVPFRQLHFAPDVWGANTYDFDPERFLRDKSLVRHPSYRPFGGGNTLCPGRYVARRSVFSVVALLFGRFDVRLDTGASTKGQACEQKFPRIDDTKPGLGALAPVDGDDVILVIQPQK